MALMFPTIRARGTNDAVQLLEGVEHRLLNQQPAWRILRADVAAFQQRWWGSGGDGTWPDNKESTKARDTRADSKKRNPALMEGTGALKKKATAESSSRPGADFLLLELTGRGPTKAFYAVFLANSGREPLGVPGQEEVDRYADAVADFILTGRPRRA